MDIFKNFINLFVEVWNKGILGIDIFQILVGLGIFLIFLLFRGLIGKIIIQRLEKIAKKPQINSMILLLKQWRAQLDFFQL